MNKKDFSQWAEAYSESFTPAPDPSLLYLGDNDGNINTSDPALVWARDRAGNVTRIRRGMIAANAPVNTPLWVDTPTTLNTNQQQVTGVAFEQIDGYNGASYQIAYVGAAEQVGYADANGNLTGSNALKWTGTQFLVFSESTGPAWVLSSFSDTLGNNPFVQGKAAGGVEQTPTAALLGKVLLRLSGSGYGTTAFSASSTGRVDLTTTENHTDANHGTEINLWSTPKLSGTAVNAASLQDDGLWAMKQGGAINRVLATGKSVTMPDGYSMVVSGYYSLEGTASLNLAGDAELAII